MIEYILYRVQHFSKVISLGVYPKNTASILLASTLLFNLMSVFKLFDSVYSKRNDAVIEIVLLLGLAIFFRVYYSIKWEYLQEKYSNESRKNKYIGFSIFLVYIIATFILAINV